MRPSREWADRLQDILDAIEAIQQFTAGRTLDEFVADPMCTHAVRHNFGIIGEAARNVPEEVWGRHPDVEWRQAIEMRNFVVHVYWAIKDSVVWRTIQEDLPILKQQVAAILAKGDDA
jgi:hypothetical protein